MGGKGVTKTWSVELIMLKLSGQKGEEKLDPGSKDSTIKRLAAYHSTPTVIYDNASSNKVYRINKTMHCSVDVLIAFCLK